MTASVLITGTAGDIGAAAAIAFAKAGLAVTGLDRDESTELLAAGLEPPPECLVGDLAAPDTIERALDAAAGRAALVHVVGVAGGATDEEIATEDRDELPTREQFAASVDLNLTMQYGLAAAAAPRLAAAAREGHAPSITLISSINALACFGLPAYSAAKAGLAGLAVALADRLGHDGIRINVLALGTIPSARTRRLYSPEHFAALEATVSLPALGRPDQIGETLVAIATGMPHTTGQVIVADGGQLVHRTAPAPEAP